MAASKEYFKEYHLKNRAKKIAAAIAWKKANPEKARANAKKYCEKHDDVRRAWREKHAEESNARTKAWIAAHKDDPEYLARKAASTAKWAADNQPRRTATENKRRAAKLQRTPKWVDEEELLLIAEVYELAKMREKCTGIKWHVDHFFPLQGKTVSGLHTLANLRVIPGSDNAKKHAKIVGDHPNSFF